MQGRANSCSQCCWKPQPWPKQDQGWVGNLNISLDFHAMGVTCIESPGKSLVPPLSPGCGTLPSPAHGTIQGRVGAVAFGCSSLTTGKWLCAKMIRQEPLSVIYLQTSKLLGLFRAIILIPLKQSLPAFLIRVLLISLDKNMDLFLTLFAATCLLCLGKLTC